MWLADGKTSGRGTVGRRTSRSGTSTRFTRNSVRPKRTTGRAIWRQPAAVPAPYWRSAPHRRPPGAGSPPFLAGGGQAAAEDCFRRLLELDNRDGQAHYNLGVVLFRQGEIEAAAASYAAACYRRLVELGHNLAATNHMLAALTGSTTAMAPNEYVRNIFDGYSDRFDHCLLEELDYKVPMMLQRLLESLMAARQVLPTPLTSAVVRGSPACPFAPGSAGSPASICRAGWWRWPPARGFTTGW